MCVDLYGVENRMCAHTKTVLPLDNVIWDDFFNVPISIAMLFVMNMCNHYILFLKVWENTNVKS